MCHNLVEYVSMLRAIFILLCSTTLPLTAAVDFRRQILPILEKNCFQCHQAPAKDNKGVLQNPKAGLRLDGAAFILKGGSSGPGVEPKDTDKSLIYIRTLLPQEHEDAMPPKGKGRPLTIAETELIKGWVTEGASFGDWVGLGAAPAPTAAARGADPLATGLKAPAPDALRKVALLGGIASPVELHSNLLSIQWVSGHARIGDKEIAQLSALGPNISELDLGKTKITDQTLTLLATFPRLTKLSLAETTITDTGLAQLSKLPHLQHLNLHSTAVSDASLRPLSTFKKLNRLYLWQTKVTPEKAALLEKALPRSTIIIN